MNEIADPREGEQTAGAVSGPRVLQVLPKLGAGGAERGAVDLARYLVREGCTALVASAGGSAEAELQKLGADQPAAASGCEEPVHAAEQRPAPGAHHPRARRAAGPCPLARPGVERVLRRAALQGAFRDHLSWRLRGQRAHPQAALQRDHGARRARDRDLGVRRRARPRALSRAARTPAPDPARRRHRRVRSRSGVRGAGAGGGPSAGS